MAGEVKQDSPSEERVPAVATEVFYREWIRSTSIDSVVQRREALTGPMRAWSSTGTVPPSTRRKRSLPSY
jgi:hypothetical protein